MANKACVVSESCLKSEELEWSGVAYEPMDRLALKCSQLLGDEPARRALGEQAFETIKGRDIAAYLKKVLGDDAGS